MNGTAASAWTLLIKPLLSHAAWNIRPVSTSAPVEWRVDYSCDESSSTAHSWLRRAYP